jgi:hypothetical protein
MCITYFCLCIESSDALTCFCTLRSVYKRLKINCNEGKNLIAAKVVILVEDLLVCSNTQENRKKERQEESIRTDRRNIVRKCKERKNKFLICLFITNLTILYFKLYNIE